MLAPKLFVISQENLRLAWLYSVDKGTTYLPV